MTRFLATLTRNSRDDLCAACGLVVFTAALVMLAGAWV